MSLSLQMLHAMQSQVAVFADEEREEVRDMNSHIERRGPVAPEWIEVLRNLAAQRRAIEQAILRSWL